MIFLVASVVIVLGMLAATLVAGNTPVLGLDLRGGVSVVLSPVGKYKPDALDVAVDVIRNRVDSLGVAEPEISRQGNDIVVDLPGRERPLQGGEPGRPDRRAALPAGADRGHPAREDADHDHHHRRARRLDHHDRAHHHDHDDHHHAAPHHDDHARSGPDAGQRVHRGRAGNNATTSTDAAATAAVASCDPNAVAALPKIPTTSREEDKRKACVVLPDKPGGPTLPRYYLGPAGLTGKAVSSAEAEFVQGQGWTVKMDLTDSGSSKWDQLASAAVPQAGRDHPRQHRAVGAADPARGHDVHVVRRHRGDLGHFTAG